MRRAQRCVGNGTPLFLKINAKIVCREILNATFVATKNVAAQIAGMF